MSLKSIVTDLASEGGIRADDAQQLTLLTFRINKAAEELYNQVDLVGSLREQVMNVSTNGEGMQITLPHYVGKLRAVRWYYPQVNLQMVDMRPKYAAKLWQSRNFISWRLKGESPLQMDITNASLLTVTFAGALDTACSVTIEGTIEGATGLVRETLTFAIGDTTKATLLSWETISAITKDVATNYDCNILDVDNVVISTLANNQLRALFQWIQLMNLPNNTNGGNQVSFSSPTTFVEVLWKQRFRPFINLTDEFICPWYDQAIIWMYKKQEALRGAAGDVNLYNAARAYKAQCDEIIKNVASDADQNTEKYINFGPNAYLQAFEFIGNNSLTGENYPYSPSGGGCGIVWP